MIFVVNSVIITLVTVLSDSLVYLFVRFFFRPTNRFSTRDERASNAVRIKQRARGPFKKKTNGEIVD